MDLELLDELEDKVDVAVSTVRELRLENELLKDETKELQEKVAGLSKNLQAIEMSQAEASELRVRCGELEKKLHGVRGRIEGIVAKMKALEA
jgi:FtsZ-binding cell division protein ZapB